MNNTHNNPPAEAMSSESMRQLSELQENSFLIVEPRDCSPHILSREFRSAYGYGSDTTSAMLEAIGESGQILKGSRDYAEHSPELAQLLDNKPTFFALSPSVVSEDIQKACRLFNADTPGAIMKISFTHHAYLEHLGGKIESFPAIKKGTDMYRVLRSIRPEGDQRSDTEVEQSMNLVTLPSRVRTDGNTRYIAMNFVEHDGHPATISRKDLDDWLERYHAAGLTIGQDIGSDDETLDNFVIYQDKLYWCDGDIAAAQPIPHADLQQHAQHMKQSLERFVR
jgi:hypothetical protein